MSISDDSKEPTPGSYDGWKTRSPYEGDERVEATDTLLITYGQLEKYWAVERLLVSALIAMLRAHGCAANCLCADCVQADSALKTVGAKR